MFKEQSETRTVGRDRPPKELKHGPLACLELASDFSKDFIFSNLYEKGKNNQQK